MPCGGIYPASNGDGKCFHCQKDEPKPDHICVEWDAYLHRNCIPAFLLTKEGEIIWKTHHHEIIMVGDEAMDECSKCGGPWSVHKDIYPDCPSELSAVMDEGCPGCHGKV